MLFQVVKQHSFYISEKGSAHESSRSRRNPCLMRKDEIITIITLFWLCFSTSLVFCLRKQCVFRRNPDAKSVRKGRQKNCSEDNLNSKSASRQYHNAVQDSVQRNTLILESN